MLTQVKSFFKLALQEMGLKSRFELKFSNASIYKCHRVGWSMKTDLWMILGLLKIYI